VIDDKLTKHKVELRPEIVSDKAPDQVLVVTPDDQAHVDAAVLAEGHEAPKLAEGAGNKSIASAMDYEHELMRESISAVLDKLQALGMRRQADVASRLLLDFCESRVSIRDAEKALAVLKADWAEMDAGSASQRPRRRRLGPVVATASLSLLMLIAVVVGLCTIHTFRHSHHHHQPISVLSNTPWQYLPAEKASSLRSLNANQATDFRIVNQSNHALRVYWINYAGEKILYATITPGNQLKQSTFATYPWLITDESDNPSLLMVAGSQAGKIFTVK
jgi:hypothetical protein